MKDSQGRVVRWFGTSTDSSEQLQREQELRRANDDLEQFAYPASHDLQEPLRNVVVYSQLLKKRYRTRLEAGGRRISGLYRGWRKADGGACLRPARLYARGVSGDGPVELTDSQAMLEQVLENLKLSIEQSHPQVTHDPLPVALVRPRHLEQLFQNLIGNSVKYRQESESPGIHVSAARQGSSWRFSVADNGIGIAPEYHDIVFGPFKRLHRNNSRFAGTGIGLAICHKIVERYGRIGIESEQGAGSVFHFTLPVASEEHLAQPVSALGSPQ